jgi:NADH-quinone oxidoreductase subunit M
MDSFLLPLLLIVPLLGAVVTSMLRGSSAKASALLFSSLTLAVGATLAAKFDWYNGGDQFGTSLGDFTAIRFSISLGADALSLLLVLTTSVLATAAIVASFPTVKSREGTYYGWLLVLLAALTGVWIARDLLLFYAFFELILVPLFFLIGSFGGPDRRQAALKIFIYTFAGSILALPAILYIGLKAQTFDIANAMIYVQGNFSPTEKFWCLLGLLASFCVKTPVFPFHTWQPSAMSESPGSGVVDCSGLVLKLGAYAILKIAVPVGLGLFPHVQITLAILAVIGILYGAVVAWVQTDMKRLLAYSSLSHVGFIVLGIVALQAIAWQGAALYLINTALSTGAMFLVVGMIYDRYGTRDMSELSGLGQKMPIMAFFFGLFTMAGIGLPLLNGFVSEFLTIQGTFLSTSLGIQYGVLAALGIILGAVYMLSMAGRVLFGAYRAPAVSEPVVKGDLNPREVGVLSVLALLVLLLGVYPSPILKALGRSVGNPAITNGLSSGQARTQAAQPGATAMSTPTSASEQTAVTSFGDGR